MSPCPALPQVTTSVVPETTLIHKAVPAHTEAEWPPPTGGEGCCTVTASLVQHPFFQMM